MRRGGGCGGVRAPRHERHKWKSHPVGGRGSGSTADTVRVRASPASCGAGWCEFGRLVMAWCRPADGEDQVRASGGCPRRWRGEEGRTTGVAMMARVVRSVKIVSCIPASPRVMVCVAMGDNLPSRRPTATQILRHFGVTGRSAEQADFSVRFARLPSAGRGRQAKNGDPRGANSGRGKRRKVLAEGRVGSADRLPPSPIPQKNKKPPPVPFQTKLGTRS